MKDLPKVSAFAIDKEIKNYQEVFKETTVERSVKPVNVLEKINDIFASNNHVYKSDVKITLKDNVVEKSIIGKTATDLLTITGEKIRIIDIVDIEKLVH